MIPEALQAKLDNLPQRPGCYVFKDQTGRVLYVGKATSLRSRVRSYFQESSSDSRSFLPLLRRNVADLETVVTASEKEATILEASLVKQLKPRYNVKLRDDKSYLSLRLDLQHPWPRLELVRRPQPDGARYFGPHHSATAARRTLSFINKHFQLRTCTDQELGSRKRPCLQYHIKRCPGPCVIEQDPAEYMRNVQAVAMFLDGRHDEVLRQVETRMKEASARMDFEQAAVHRDQLVALRAVREGQRVVAVSDVDQDVIGLHRDGELCEVAVVFVRAGRVVDTTTFPMRKVEVPDEELVGALLSQYYGEEGPAGNAVPDEILVPVLPEGAVGVTDWLSERRGRRVKLIAPQRGPRAQLRKMADDNARHGFDEKRRSREDMAERLADVQARLRLPSPPRVLECCDISHLGGGDTVGGLVRFTDGEPSKQGYRTYHVRSVRDGDDYAAIYEVLARRFRRGRDAAVAAQAAGTSAEGSEEVADDSRDEASGEAGGWQLPDLFVVDGGRGQLRAALTAARDLGLHELSIVSLAKERESATGETLTDRVYLPGQKNGIPVRPHTALVILARARDEAHRFANRARERLGKTRRLRSSLDEVEGIGDAGRRRLLTAFDGVEAIRGASDEQLLAVPGITRRHVAALRQHFGDGGGGAGEAPAGSGQ